MSARLTITDRPLPTEQPLRGGLRGMVVTTLLCLLLFAALNAVLARLASRGGQSHLKLA